jgi:CDP-glucose 4,6-dehydratase
MENMEIKKSFWKNQTVFITGHTGFKGAWTSLWLSTLGAKVYGYSLLPISKESFFEKINLKKIIFKSIIGDINDIENLINNIKLAQPSIILHFAAQSLVRESYNSPINTFMTNIIGTANVFEAARTVNTVKAIINVTSDKCYENIDLGRSLNENDKLGGHDPYSASKACSELITNAYNKSFFFNSEINIASVRAGNVIGGGDWAKDRIVPDLVRAIENDQTLKIRYPEAIRPWQHVLEPISGYILLAKKLVIERNKYTGAWNFGPSKNSEIKVIDVVKFFSKKFNKLRYEIDDSQNLYESKLLKIDSSKSKSQLKWKNIWDIETSLNKTIEWYQARSNKKNMLEVSLSQIKSYETQKTIV